MSPASARRHLWAALAALALLTDLAEGRRLARHKASASTFEFLGLSSSESPSAPSGSADDIKPVTAGSSGQFLLATFPDMKQVAYCHAPDNVWRPMVTGDLEGPTAIAVDSQNARLFVSDQASNVIWRWQLGVQPGGFLETQGNRIAAVEGYNASRIAVNSVGDLYFVGYAVPSDGSAPDTTDAIYRMNAQSLAQMNPLNPTLVYSQANTGSPDPMAWAPSGLAVDSFFIYWGNKEAGTTHGSVVKGSRMNIGLAVTDLSVVQMNSAFPEVRGLTATGTHVFFLTPNGVHGVLKTESGVTNPVVGLIATENGSPAPTADASSASGNFSDITWDGGNSLYLAASGVAGAIYSLPALNTQAHSLEKFVDAPGIQSVAVYLHVSQGGTYKGSAYSGAGGLRTHAATTMMLLAAAVATRAW